MEFKGVAGPDEIKQSLRATYDKYSAERDRLGESEWRIPYRRGFLATIQRENLESLLEIGAGPGHTAKWFADQGLSVVAIDLSAENVARCRAKGLNAYHRDFYDLGFRLESFDAIWAMNCLLHVPNSDFRGVLEGIHDVLAIGGLFFLGLWGGIDNEGLYVDDSYDPPRFYSLRSDETLRRLVGEVFAIESFSTLDLEAEDDDRLHMQLVVARRR
jgi:SAM-dependent methyltransferase